MSDFEHFNSLNNFRRYINIYFKKLKKILKNGGSDISSEEKDHGG